MSRIIRVDVSPLEQIVPSIEATDRKQYIQQQKQAIYQYRNQLLTTFLDQAIDLDQIAKTEFGKPFLPDFPQFSFNHSHSQKHYALATSDKIRDLGVDIEDLDRKVRFEALAKHAFHPEEWDNWKSLDFELDYWFKVWTTKEAVLKASGIGIRLSLNELNTHIHPEQDGGMCEHQMIGHFAYQNFTLPHAMLTVAWQADLSCRGFAFPMIQIVQG
ncbi:4'-phosphopantetheinyl transferase family protein [Acinetobacter gerneri]|uniref:4'-phosphopantetheinyl transferase family protein n=1 Tax=Acinetobacter gerneri TaxID=202952 RepID=UPI003A875F06